MNFARVCGVVACAVTAFLGCGDDRDTTSTNDGTPAAQADDAERQTLPTAEVVSAAVAPSCTITISGPSSAMIGPPIHLTATASCNISTPEILWQHRLGSSGTFSMLKPFNAATSTDFTTLGQTLGLHQFRARARAQGTTATVTSNTVSTSLVVNTTPCTAVVLDT